MKRKVVVEVVQFYLDLTITAYGQVEAVREDLEAERKNVAVLTDVNRDLMAENLRLEQELEKLEAIRLNWIRERDQRIKESST